MPLKFCPCRWVENGIVAERAIQLWPNIAKYVASHQQQKNSTAVPLFSPRTTLSKPLKRPTNKWFRVIESACQDPFVVAKLQFFKCISDEVVPFLKRYQMDAPMLPFLKEDLLGVLVSIMKRFIRPEIMTGMTTCSKIAKFEVLNNESHVDGHDVDVGFAARHTLRSVKCNERTKLEFFMDCRVFLVKMIDKMLQRSPLRYSVVRYAPCFCLISWPQTILN
jgi:hypothetical protein